MGRKLKKIEITSMKKAIDESEKDIEEYEFKIELKQLQIDKGLEVNLRIKKRELSEEIKTLKGNLNFANTVIEKYSQCVKTGYVEIDAEKKSQKIIK